MNYSYRTSGTCSQEITFDYIDGKVYNVEFIGGCAGNQQGISNLVEGMDAQKLVDTLGGIRCGFKPTSCPDQLAKAVKKAMEG